MKRSRTLAVAFAISLAGPNAAYATEENATPAHHHRYPVRHHHVAAHKSVPAASTAQSAPTLAKPATAPAVQHDSDGLSRDPEDCMMGCLDTTY